VFTYATSRFTVIILSLNHPVDQALTSMLAEARELHRRIVPERDKVWYLQRVTVDEAAVYASLPKMCSIFSDINLFFRTHLLLARPVS